MANGRARLAVVLLSSLVLASGVTFAQAGAGKAIDVGVDVKPLDDAGAYLCTVSVNELATGKALMEGRVAVLRGEPGAMQTKMPETGERVVVQVLVGGDENQATLSYEVEVQTAAGIPVARQKATLAL